MAAAAAVPVAVPLLLLGQGGAGATPSPSLGPKTSEPTSEAAQQAPAATSPGELTGNPTPVSATSAPQAFAASPMPASVTSGPSPSTNQPPTNQPVPQPVSQSTSAASTSGSGSISSGFQACVIQHESRGDYQVMNSSGHYGAYQFSQSTWVAYGGSPSTFGSATPAQQDQVFNNAIAAGGASNWSSYDGC